MDLLSALSPIVPQPSHPCLTEEEGSAAALLLPPALGPFVHVRTSEYSVFAGPDVVARVGHASVGAWALEELALAGAWRRAGAPVVEPVSRSLLPLGSAMGSLWRRHPGRLDGSSLREWSEAGAALALMHRVVPGHPSFPVFASRPWRAPGKVARRLLVLGERFPGEEVLLSLASLLRERALALAAAAGGDVSAVHGDFQPCNWLVDPFVVLDFATSCVGPRAWDFTLAYARTRPGSLWTEEHWGALCSAYEAAGGILPTGEAWSQAASLRSLSSCVADLTSGAPGAWDRARAVAAGS